MKVWEHNRLMSNISPPFDCPNFGSPWFSKHFAVLQWWTKLLEKTKHEQNKNHLLTSPSHPLPLCNDNRTQTGKKTLTYCFSLHNSTTVTSPSPPPPLPLMQCWYGKWCLPWPKRQTLSQGEGEGDLVVCLCTSERAWKANFLTCFVHVWLVFQIIRSLKVSTVHELCLVAPVVVSKSNVWDDIMVAFAGCNKPKIDQGSRDKQLAHRTG